MGMTKTTNHYEKLGIPEGSDESTIKKAYRALALELHPDRSQNKPESVQKANAIRFGEVNEAYTALTKAPGSTEARRPQESTASSRAAQTAFDAMFREIFNDIIDELFSKKPCVFDQFDFNTEQGILKATSAVINSPEEAKIYLSKLNEAYNKNPEHIEKTAAGVVPAVEFLLYSVRSPINTTDGVKLVCYTIRIKVHDGEARLPRQALNDIHSPTILNILEPYASRTKFSAWVKRVLSRPSCKA